MIDQFEPMWADADWNRLSLSLGRRVDRVDTDARRRRELGLLSKTVDDNDINGPDGTRSAEDEPSEQ